MNEELNWAPLLDGLRRGDPDPVRAFWEQHGSRVCALVCGSWPRQLLRRESPEDLGESIFGSFYRCLKGGKFQFDDIGQLLALLGGVARNKIENKIRDHYRERRSPKREQHPSDEQALNFAAVDRAPTPLEQVEEKDFVLALHEAVAELNENERRAVELLLAGQTNVEIAPQLKCSASMVGRHIKSARSRLRKQLEVPRE